MSRLAVLLAAIALAGGAAAQTVTVVSSVAEFQALYTGADGSWPDDSVADNLSGHSIAETSALPAFADRQITVFNSGFGFWTNPDWCCNTGPGDGRPAKFTFVQGGSQVYGFNFAIPQRGLLFEAITSNGAETLVLTFEDETTHTLANGQMTFAASAKSTFSGVSVEGKLIKSAVLTLTDGSGHNQGLSGLWVSDPTPCVGENPATPTLVLDDSGIQSGDLVVAVNVASERYTSVGWKFVGAALGTCDDVNGDQAELWALEEGGGDCPDRHTLQVPLTQALKECGFSSEPQDGGDTWYYEAVLEATTEEPNGTVFGEDTTRTLTTAFRVRVEVPKSVDVSASAVAYGSVIQFALLSQQEVDTSSATAAFTWTLVTSVQYPYQLTAKEVTEESAHDFESLTITEAAPVCPASGACTQTFEIAATETTSCELTDAELKSVFTIGCRSQFSGSCDTPEGVETDTATFTVSTDSFCARVAEVATVTPTLTTSTSQGGASASDFVLQTTLFGRVTFAIEAGLSVTETRLLSLDLVSEETVQPVTGAGVQDSAVVSAISFLESDQGGTAPHLDFQFQLNTDSVKFAVGGGQASLTITAVVEVTYDGAGSQRFEVSTEAVSGPGAVSTAASSTVGISTPAAGGSSTTAGSTVLGVSTGTAMVAGVGLVAVVALAAGAAVVARKRRASAARRLKPASSSVELNDTAAVQV